MENLSGQSFDTMKLQKDLMDSPWVTCNCGCHLYDEATLFKRLSSILSPTGSTEYVPAKVVLCRSCGEVPGWFSEMSPGLPKEICNSSKKES